ncbi:XkdQ/YqbQ family protein [Sporosarcina sp. A2]|uniref:XkdQ/YqbQ family protein n=1 Tax=Sporosarcina sp. A2 TaxID=3393449 RepID=UPI003D7A89EE
MAYTRTYSEYEERLKPTLRFYLYNDSYRWDFTEMVQSHSFGGDINTAAESFSISVWNRQESNDRRKLPFDEGLMVKVMLEYKADKGQPDKPKELFRGIIISRSLSAEGEESLSIYDYNWYLAQNEVTKSFCKKRADQIVAELGRIAGVPIGYMANTKLVFTELEFIDKTIWEIMQTVISETYLRTGKRYKIRSENGFLALREMAVSMKRLLIERGANMLGANRETSIQDVKTQVIMTGGKSADNPRQLRTDVAAKKKYGTMTVIENDPDITGPGGLGSLANALLKKLKEPKDEISVDALADYTITAGTMIEAYDEFTGASGYYYVTSHSHSDGKSMSLQLSKSFEQEFVRYEVPEAKEESLANVDGKLTDVSYISGYTGTAYDPRLGGINGSGDYLTTASGTRWAYNRTIAVDPSVIPYGSVVHIYVPGFPQYSSIYLAEDTGGAIKGKRVDVLIKGKSDTAKFGRRGVQIAILEKGTGKADARNKANKWASVKENFAKKFKPAKSTKASTKRQKVVEIAKGYKGKLKYKFGGKNIATGAGDCSGFTYAVMKKAGLDIGHGTTSQVTKGKKVSKSAAQPGDLVFFKGTYRAGVSHVGIVTTKGNCVSLANSGCLEHSYTSGYWAKHFMQINKVL